MVAHSPRSILVFIRFCLFINSMVFCASYGHAGAGNEEVVRNDSKTINELKNDLKVSNKQLKRQRNDLIILHGDMKKQGLKNVSLEKKSKLQKKYAYLLGLVLVLTLAFIFTLVRSARSKQKYVNLLKAESAEVAVQRELFATQKEHTERVLADLTASIHYAVGIQNAVLADPKRIAEMLTSDFFILYKPKDIVSGDFYFMEQKGDWCVAAVGDCTGHGVPGALLSMLAITMLNDIIQKKNVLVASEILNELREKMVFAMMQNDLLNNQNDGLDISLLLVNRKEMIGQWSGANSPLVQINKHKNVLLEVKADKRPIGDYPDMDNFTNHAFAIQTGDRFYLFSDGYSDQFGGPCGKKFMKKRFKEDLLAHAKLPMSEQNRQMTAALENWISCGVDKIEQVDDITVFGIEI